MSTPRWIPVLFVLPVLPACAVHVEGTREERERAEAVGRELEPETPPPALSEDPSLEEYLALAFHESSLLRQRYWEWRAAIERVPQAASAPDLALSFSQAVGTGGSFWDNTTVMLQNSPMAMLPVPSKLEAAGRRALEEARAAGLRFDAERLHLQAAVTDLYLDLALHGVLMELQHEELGVRELASRAVELRVETGEASQQEALAAHSALDMARDGVAALHAELPSLTGRLNALLGRHPLHPVPFPSSLPEPRPLGATDVEILEQAARRSPELAALAHEVAGREAGLELATLARYPDLGFLLGVTGSVSRTFGGMVTMPLRREAIRAGIAEAEAAVRAAEEARTRYERDLAATFAIDLFVLHGAERQAALFEHTLLPRAETGVSLARASFETGQGGLAELGAAELERLDVLRTLAGLRIEREKAWSALATWSPLDVGALHPVMGGKR